jgi:hypothetical protein
MSPFEYIFALISVLVGLAIADLATSLHRLLQSRDRVQWDWLPLTAAFLAILAVLDIWWGLYGTQEATFYQSLAGFLPLAAQLFLLFLINAAALPNKVPQDGIKLQSFYEDNSSYFWSLFAVYVFVVTVHQSSFRLMADWDFIAILTRSLPNLIILALYISLATIKNRVFHMVIVPVLLIWYVIEWSGRTLGAV